MTGCTDCGWSYMDKCEVYDDGTCRRDHDFDDSEPEEKEEIELKPCPFCGGEAMISPYLELGNLYMVKCRECNIGRAGKSEEEAVKEWNARPNPWHKGTPTENGWYLLECGIGNSDNTYYTTDYWSDTTGYWAVNRVIRWRKIDEGKEER